MILRKQNKLEKHLTRENSFCNICGCDSFGHGPNNRLSVTGFLPRCEQCNSLERHRAIRSVWMALPHDWLKHRIAIQISSDRSILPAWFKNYELSIYGGKNSLDLENIEREDKSVDIIICNHVLEHIKDDFKAFREMMRVLRPEGFLQLTVPNPMAVAKTYDWGYPKEEQHGHFRIYGKDIVERFKRAIPEVLVHQLIARDPVTEVEDYVYFWSKSKSVMAKLKKWIVLNYTI